MLKKVLTIILNVDKSGHIHYTLLICLVLNVIFYSLSKEFFYSFGFFLALWGRRECVGTVAVGWPLWQPGQIQMVGALSLCFSCINKCPQKIINITSISVASLEMELLHGTSVGRGPENTQTDTWRLLDLDRLGGHGECIKSSNFSSMHALDMADGSLRLELEKKKRSSLVVLF